MKLKDIVVLVADDSDITTEMLTFMLGEEGAHPTVARNGVEAVAYACQQSFDIILMDIQMPECNGIEATKRIRASNAANKNTPIIAVSGASEAESEDFMAEGFTDFLQKPVNFPKLMGLIKRHVLS
jgi:CheY-like chemotaxis protein